MSDTGPQIRERFRTARIAHHYFFQPGSTMRPFPLLRFDRWRYPENYAKLHRVLQAEKPRLHEWDTGTPKPFTHLQELLFPGF